MDTDKAMFGDSAREVLAKLILNEPRNRTIPLPLTGEEGLQLFGNDAVQHRGFRLPRYVLERSVQHAGALSSSPARCRD